MVHESLHEVKRLRECDRILSKLLTLLYAVAKERENLGQLSLVLEGRTKSSSSLRASSRKSVVFQASLWERKRWKKRPAAGPV